MGKTVWILVYNYEDIVKLIALRQTVWQFASSTISS
jgi:hypothetical protein